MTTAPKLIDQTSPAARAAKAKLKKLGYETWVHDQVYALVYDDFSPHGWRVVERAHSFTQLLKNLK